jgi:hypothetical protein
VPLRRALPSLVLSALPALAAAQTSPFLPDPLFRELADEISGDRAFESVRQLSHYHRTDGSRDFFAAAEWLRGAAVAAGLEDVKLVRQKWKGHGWSCSSGAAWIVEPERAKLGDYGEVPLFIADHSRTTHLTAELVDVGAGTGEADYAGREVKGRVVLASGAPAKVQELAVWKRGALGVVSYATNRPSAFDAPDQIAWGRLPYEARGIEGVKDGTPSAFAIMLSPRRGEELRGRAQAAEKPLKLKVDIEADYPAVQEQAYVEAWIKGTEIRDQQIVLTAHIQEEKTSANDDGSGCASVLEIGRSLAKLVREGRIPRPRRDIRFWWVNELDSQPQLFRESPQEPRKMLLAVNQDMVGARQSWGGRVQYASRSPWSLPHALDDVMESVLGLVRDSNTSLLAYGGTNTPFFTREVVAHKGSREPFHARMVPYFANSDHHAFTPARIGVPATALISWPDQYIHSSGDDLESIDATQLQRNALVVAGVALYFARASEEDAAGLAAYVGAQARRRVAADLASAIAHVLEAPAAQRDAAYRRGRSLVHQSNLKEQGAVLSVRRLAGRGRGAELVDQMQKALEDQEGADLDALERAYVGVAGKNPPNPEPSKAEREMMAKIYVPTPDLGTWIDALSEKVKPVNGLHAVMQFEAMNFADGRRSAYEVYEAVGAEALSAGRHYYGEVTPEKVLEALERAAKAGAFSSRSR